MQIKQTLLGLCLTGLLTLCLQAQTPRIENAEFETRAATNGLGVAIETLVKQSSDPVWIGYRVAMSPNDKQMCCFRGGLDSPKGCHLEEGGFQEFLGSHEADSDPSRTLLVMVRAEAGEVDRLKAFASDCPLDAGGLRVYWLGRTETAQSVDYLRSIIAGSDESTERLTNRALTAIAHHAGPSADAALGDFLESGRPRKLRKKAAFWLGAARGARGFEVLRDTVRNDADEQFRADAMFALNVSHEPKAIDELIRAAREDVSARVRKQALFWLAQKAGEKATAMLGEAIERDPDTKVKKQAVFGLSRLPKDQGIPLLIEVARTNRNPTVRKQAMFWLSQSSDTRALQFFEEVLTR